MRLRKLFCPLVDVMAKLTGSKSCVCLYHADRSNKYWVEDVHDQRIMGCYYLGFDRTSYVYSDF